MSVREAKLLAVGDRVLWRADGVCGTVVELLVQGVVIDWDDGKLGQGIAFVDCYRLSKEA